MIINSSKVQVNGLTLTTLPNVLGRTSNVHNVLIIDFSYVENLFVKLPKSAVL
jgi:hypothetical protein